jgi:uncharacterized membrane protein (DUF485 family)
MAVEESKNKVTVSWGLILSVMFSTITITFTLTTIYWQFQQQGFDIQLNKDQIKYERERVDRKFKSLHEDEETK